jgi:hypothetical protein
MREISAPIGFHADKARKGEGNCAWRRQTEGNRTLFSLYQKTKPDSRKQKPRQTLAWAWATGILQFPKSKREKSQFFWPANPTTPALENKTSNTLNKKNLLKRTRKICVDLHKYKRRTSYSRSRTWLIQIRVVLVNGEQLCPNELSLS